MCGITAFFAYHSSAEAIRAEELDAVTDSMAARGPDARGTWISPDARVGLGNRRLAIIDVSPDGTQPIWDSERELVIVFNGEIYNYQELRAQLERGGARFHTHTDTEVLLQLYRRDGPAMAGLLRGMFALVIWDTRAQRMFVARDPYGIKPLYFADDGKTIRFASQVKALLAGGAVSRTLDPAGIAGFYLFGSVPEPFTIRESIRAMEPGTWMTIDANGRSETKKYFSIAEIFRRAVEQQSLARLTEPEILVAERVTESVAHHLVSDVPVGVFLSAGIDSSALTLLASQLSREPLHTFTLTFEEFRGRADDEAPPAERFARVLGTNHRSRVVTREEFAADLPRIFAAMDQPTIDGVNTWFISKAVHESGIKVALSGLGGDELFGGYPSFTDIPRIVRAPKFARSIASRMTKNPKAPALAEYGGTFAGAYLVKRGLFMPAEIPNDVAEEGLRRLGIFEHTRALLDPDPESAFGRVATLEATMYMRNQLLRDTDWASMAHSVEARTPLVDASLLRQLAPLVVDQGTRCKQHFAAILPKELRERKKTGFFVPLKEWAGLADDGTTTRMRSWAKMVFERSVMG
ncbi:MAG TPA: asparagine synthase (glutamine-hydrolyzing) [Thermoanaerobaculia bacterium]|nr:asparagine synthase (glutamine-hydrolyzing) [Thermoanaerobaculia bacterium]